jgi:hypothetical protein
MATTTVLLANAKNLAVPIQTDVATPEAPASSRPTGLETAAPSPRAPTTNKAIISTMKKDLPCEVFFILC